jgi:hypothetical protein
MDFKETAYEGVWATGWMNGGSSPAGAGNFSLHHRVQTGFEAHPASYPMGNRGSLSGSKAAGAWSWPPQSSAEVKNAWSYTSAPPVRLHSVVFSFKKAQWQFYH